MARTSSTSRQQNCDPLSLQLGPTATIAKPSQRPNNNNMARRARRSRSNPVPEGKSVTIVPPYPWATDRRARIHSMEYLTAQGITTITGDVECKRCNQRYEIALDLREKFDDVAGFIRENRYRMNDRAPRVWAEPTLEDCRMCGQVESVRPVIEKRRNINWLFLLLAQWIGCCKLWDLKYFCKHTLNHRTGAKDRVLYLTYLALCKQLLPSESAPFDL